MYLRGVGMRTGKGGSCGELVGVRGTFIEIWSGVMWCDVVWCGVKWSEVEGVVVVMFLL